MVVAAGALAGLPPLAGFFSKEVIMADLAALANPMWFAAGVLGVFLTAYYTFRLIFVVFFPQDASRGTGISDTVSDHGDTAHHEWAYRAMAWPLVVLAGFTVVLGFFEHPLKGFLLGHSAGAAAHKAGPAIWVTLVPLVAAAAGVGLAWLEFGRRGAPRVGFADRIPSLQRLFEERWYLDHAYRFLLDRVVDRGISALCFQTDNKVIDGGIDGMSRGTVDGGRFLAFLHTGGIQARLLVTFAVMVFLSLYYFFG
jgi:NADH-quinone oxidoreductase subunit L